MLCGRSPIETENMNDWAISMTRRRSKLSAKTPARREKTMIGSVTDDCTRATMLSDCDSKVIIQAAPTACTSPPKFEVSAAIQSIRNVWLRNSARMDVLCGTLQVSGSVSILRWIRWRRR